LYKKSPRTNRGLGGGRTGGVKSHLREIGGLGRRVVVAEDSAEEIVNFFAGHSFGVKEGHTDSTFILKGVGGWDRLCHVKHFLNSINISKELYFV